MKNYYTGKASDFIEQTVSQLVTNDDLYNECTRLVEINKTCDKLTRLKNCVVLSNLNYAKEFIVRLTRLVLNL